MAEMIVCDVCGKVHVKDSVIVRRYAIAIKDREYDNGKTIGIDICKDCIKGNDGADVIGDLIIDAIKETLGE